MKLRVLKAPGQRLIVLWLAMVPAALAAVWLALQEPSLGLRLGVDASGSSVKVLEATAAVGVVPGAMVSYLQAADDRRLVLVPSDLIEEPDFFDGYQQMEAFFQRQGAIDSLLRSGELLLGWHTDDGKSGETRIHPGQRTLDELPIAFWFQLAVGGGCFLIAGWVFALRPHDWAARMFFVTAAALLLSAFSAAIYSSRALVLPENVFRTLSLLNHFGATTFGMALVALFLCYPRSLVRPVWLLVLPAIFLPWFLADALRLAPNLDWGVRIPLLIELSLALLCIIVQWRVSGTDPRARAALIWLALSTLISSGLFLVLVPGYSMLGLEPPLTQSGAFGFFLIMYLGIALGLRRYRLFDVGEWAYRVLLWVGGAVLVVLIDIALVTIGLAEPVSLALTLFLAGWVYFPLRQWLWARVIQRQAMQLESLLPQVLHFAFMADDRAREAHWDNLLRRAFDALEVERATGSFPRAEVRRDGLTLGVPETGSLAAREIHHPAAGSRLFSRRDADLADALCSLVANIDEGHRRHETAVREERQRLARDLHDNLGARLLRLIHHLRGRAEVDIARDAMRDLRAAVRAIDAAPARMDDALADWRAETDHRCRAAGVALQWQQADLPELTLAPRVTVALGAVLREAVTNALKHATPAHLIVRISHEARTLTLAVINDGVVASPAQWQEGYGLRSIRGRLHELGGRLAMDVEDGKTCVRVILPMAALGP